MQLIECPRDAMQGWPGMIPTEQKLRYLNALLKVGFHTLDFGSFVSAKAIPQMADTGSIVDQLELNAGGTQLLAIVANERGARESLVFEQIRYLGFPFSISPTFQLRNTNSTPEESLGRVDDILELCVKSGKEMVVYLSMGFGNPYGDPYHEEILLQWADVMVSKGIRILSLADTVGMATPAQVHTALNALIPAYPEVTIGVHLHAAPHEWKEKIQAAVDSGCVRFDGAMKGIGGCPMAQDALVGNMDTEQLIPYFESMGMLPSLDSMALAESSRIAAEIFMNV